MGCGIPNPKRSNFSRVLLESAKKILTARLEGGN